MTCVHGIPYSNAKGLGCNCCGGPAGHEADGGFYCFPCLSTQRPALFEQRDAAVAAAEALEARYRAGIRTALRALHAVHASLPDGDALPRQSADALALAVEGALLAALGGES